MTGILPLLATLHVLAGAFLFRVRAPGGDAHHADAGDAALAPMLDAGAARRSLGTAPYLRRLGLLVFVVTLGAGLLDYVFKARTVAAVASGGSLLRFFAVFHTAVSLGTFLVQSAASRISMKRLGLMGRVAAHPLAVLFGSLATLAVPGVGAAAAARAVQTVLYNSLFRSGYEVLFTPIAPRDKRSAKAIIDVGCERAGDAASGGLIRILLMLPAVFALPAILVLGAVAAGIGCIVSGRLQRGYVGQLERRLVSGVFRVTPEQIDDPLTRTMLLRTIDLSDLRSAAAASAGSVAEPLDSHEVRIRELRSGDPVRVAAALASAPIDVDLAPHAIALLAWDAAYPHAAQALAAAREGIEPQIVERMLDTQEDFAIRRRIPWILSHSSTPIAIAGLLQGLLDPRFEVRFRCGQALARIHARDPSLPIDRQRVFTIVLRETRVDHGVWESQRLLDQLQDDSDEPFVAEFVRQRSNRSLEHVFTVLSLALDRRPLQVAFQGLHTDDAMLRGTALEYLETVLPAEIRESLWPFLEDHGEKRPVAGDRGAILDALISSHESIEINLAQLREKLREQR
jgi:ATP:ADP antiporter, AAA family